MPRHIWSALLSVAIVTLLITGCDDNFDDSPPEVSDDPLPIGDTSERDPNFPAALDGTDDNLGAIGGDITIPPDQCNSTVSVTFMAYQNFSHLVWSSEQISHGTVIDELPSEIHAVANPNANAPEQVWIVTDYVIDVHASARGEERETITIRMPGGTIEDCTQTWMNLPTFNKGDDVLLFLNTWDSEPARDIFLPIGGNQGFWPIDENGMVVSRFEDLHGDPVANVLQQARNTLEQNPEISNRPEFVPLDDAPALGN